MGKFNLLKNNVTKLTAVTRRQSYSYFGRTQSRKNELSGKIKMVRFNDHTATATDGQKPKNVCFSEISVRRPVLDRQKVPSCNKKQATNQTLSCTACQFNRPPENHNSNKEGYTHPQPVPIKIVSIAPSDCIFSISGILKLQLASTRLTLSTTQNDFQNPHKIPCLK